VAALVEAGLQTFLAGLSFHLASTTSLRILADDTISRFSSYPLTMFDRWGFLSLTFAFPMAFIAYLPASRGSGSNASVTAPAGRGGPSWGVWPYLRRHRPRVAGGRG